jgi:uncharacterized protein YndB with AHSA1/START domain
MAFSVTTSIEAPSARVFDVISDPRTYPDWLLGAQKIRKVDASWPKPGAAFHHTVGAGPIRVSDHTSVLALDPLRSLELRAHVGPMGSARVIFTLREEHGVTEVDLEERPDGGLMRVLWSTVGRAALALGIWGRNGASLQQLKAYIESDAADVGPASSSTGPRASRRASATTEPVR